MAKPPITDEAFEEHFRALSFEDQQTMLKSCQDIMAEAVAEKRRQLQEELAKLDALSPSPPPALNGKQAEGGRPRGPAKITHRGPGGETWTNRGQPPGWLKALEATGRSRDEFKVSE